MLWVQFSHTDHWMFNMAPHGKELSEDLRISIVALHIDGGGYKKISDNLKLSYSTVARVIQRFSKTGFTRNRHRKGRSKKLSPCAVRQVLKLASKNRCMSAASIALEVAEVEGQLVSAQTIRRTLQQVSLHDRRPRRKPLLKLAHKKSLQTVCWRQPVQEHELLEPCPVVWWDSDKLVWLRCCPACVAMPWWGVPRKLCLAYSQAWWW